jgi:pseudaminic acid cytidylyltransferase
VNVAIIPARGGSRRIPRKNIRMFHGQPIIAYSIATAKGALLFDKVIVSTDDEEIAWVSRKCGAEVHMRSAEMARDEVGTQAVVRNVLQEVDPFLRIQDVCCVYATAPTLRGSDLIIAHQCMVAGGVYIYTHGLFYWGRAEWFMNESPLTEGAKYVVANEYIDINTPEDWALAEEMYAARRLKG